MATSATQPPPPTPNNGEQDPTPSRLNQEVQEQPNKGPKIMKKVQKINRRGTAYTIFLFSVKRLF